MISMHLRGTLRGLSLLVAVLLADSAWAQAGPVSPELSDEQTIRQIPDEELLGVLVQAEKPGGRRQALEDFRSHPKERRLGTLAYSLKEGKHRSSALQMIFDDEEMQDRRLAPFVAEVIRTGRGKELFWGVRAANKLPPDQVLLAPLLDHALESEYVDVSMVGGMGGSVEFIYWSVFAEAAEAIFRITRGKIGSERVERGSAPSPQEQKTLIQQWRDTWKAERKGEE